MLMYNEPKCCKYDFLHILAPVVYIIALAIWAIISRILFTGKMTLGIGLLLSGFSVATMIFLAKHYYVQKSEIEDY
jgi:hypothetical protein